MGAAKTAVKAIHTIDVSDQGGFGHVSIDAEERVAALGYVIENRFMGQALLQGLRVSERVTVFAPAEFSRPKGGSRWFYRYCYACRSGVTGSHRFAGGRRWRRFPPPVCSWASALVVRHMDNKAIVTALVADRAHAGACVGTF